MVCPLFMMICIHIGWSYVKTPDQLVYYKLHLVRSDAAPEIEFSLQFESDFSWKLHYCGLEVLTENCSLLANLPPLLSCVSLVYREVLHLALF